LKKNSEENTMFFLSERLVFPPVESANTEGLLAVGGDLSSARLLLAYQNGIFPWFNEDSLILWWSPDPRMVLFPDKIKISKSMRKVLKSNQFRLTKNTCFAKVLDQCSTIKRGGQEGTWISNDMKEAYMKLHDSGFAKSYEVWENDVLVGGLYGIDMGHVFCGESMFSTKSNASKFAFIKMTEELRQVEYKLIDCQLHTTHLESLGAEEISRPAFMKILQRDN